MKIWPVVIATLFTVLLAPGAVGAERAPVRVGVVLKSLDNPFFVAMLEGLSAEAKHLGARITVRSARGEADSTGQAGFARSLVTGRHDCYIVNPVNGTNLLPALRGVRAPIVNIDSPIDRAAAERTGIRIRTFIGTDDRRAGKRAGIAMASSLRGRGEVALVGGLVGSVNSVRRLAGFRSGIAGTRVRVVQRANADYERTKAQRVAEQGLRSHRRLAGFFAANDLMALGIADAVRALGRSGTLEVIGIDGIPAALDAIRAGTLSATVAQYPYVMGQMAVEACVAATRGARLPPRVDSPIQLVTKANVSRVTTAFPRPFRKFSDPFRRILQKQP